MNRQDKILAWGRDRLARREQDMETFLGYLYEEQRESADADMDLQEIIRVIEAEKAQAMLAEHRLVHRLQSREAPMVA